MRLHYDLTLSSVLHRIKASIFSPFIPFKMLMFLVFQMLTFIMLARVSKLCPAAVVQRLDRLVEPLKATCTTKVRPNMTVVCNKTWDVVL